MNNKFNIQIPFFPGFYETRLSLDYSYIMDYINYYNEENGTNYGYDDFDVDYDGWEDNCKSNFVEFFKDEAPEGLIVDITNVEIDSPRYYNFRNDELFGDVELCEDWQPKLLAFMEANKEWLSERIKEEWSSYDGFISFMDNTYDDWYKQISSEDPDSRYIGVMIGYMMYKEDEHISDTLIDFTYERSYENDFYVSLKEEFTVK